MTGAVHTPTEEVLPPGREFNLQDKTMASGSHEFYEKKNADELRLFLHQRGVSTTNKRKPDLVRLAEAAEHIDLQVIEDNETYEQSSIDRRTVNVDGEWQVLPDVFSIASDKWFKHVPNIDFGDIFIYLSLNCQWDNDRIRRHKDDNSYKLFMQNHIDHVKYFKHDNNYVYIKATCVPETRQSESPYTCWILAETNGCVKSGGCTCVA